MRKIILLAIAICGLTALHAQNPSPADSLKEYTGKYKFAEGSPFPEVKVTIENGVLTANSVAGAAELKRREGDVFDINPYNGTAIFKRNADRKIVKLQVQVDQLDVEGDKTEDGLIFSILWRYK